MTNKTKVIDWHMVNIKSYDLLSAMVRNFPGLVDGTCDVNGADLVEWVGNAIADERQLLETLQLEL